MNSSNGDPDPDPDVVAFDGDDYDWSRATPSKVRIAREPKSAMSVRFTAEDIERLRQRAEADGIGVTQLIRNWVLERLEEPEPAQAVNDLLQGLEKSMRAARTIKRTSKAS